MLNLQKSFSFRWHSYTNTFRGYVLLVFAFGELIFIVLKGFSGQLEAIQCPIKSLTNFFTSLNTKKVIEKSINFEFFPSFRNLYDFI